MMRDMEANETTHQSSGSGKRGIVIALVALVVVLAVAFFAYDALAANAREEQLAAAKEQAQATEHDPELPRLVDFNATVYTETGEPFTLDQIAQGKPFVMNFWATWCPYCIQEMDDCQKLYNEYKDRVGEIISGMVQRRDKGSWVVNLGRTEALLPRDEQIPHERYKTNDRIQAIIIDVRREGRGPQVIISRAHRDYMAALFRREVPEVDDGTVQIMGIARDPGSRAKVAVFSRDRDIDPVGACVGVRGSRIQNIVQELHGERIDIVVWNPDIAVYARNALSPAVVSHINVDEEANLLEVTVPDDQFANAIGKKGQHVRLAAKLLGWKIDIFVESRANENRSFGRDMEKIASVAEVSPERFLAAGFHSLEEISGATDEDLVKRLDLSQERVADLRAAINFLMPSGKDKADQDDRA